MHECGAAARGARRRPGSGDEPLLAALLTVFAWAAPGRARALPERVFERLRLAQPAAGPPLDAARIDRLDTRPWFLPHG
ncbi:MAG: hypothetical protein IT532_06060 [Burkholderiales bacterium]|nr:hypothetical protein [Burkholderiales bacterium]